LRSDKVKVIVGGKVIRYISVKEAERIVAEGNATAVDPKNILSGIQPVTK
jgi:hypothetical protein